jgi:hypothetical protein
MIGLTIGATSYMLGPAEHIFKIRRAILVRWFFLCLSLGANLLVMSCSQTLPAAASNRTLHFPAKSVGTVLLDKKGAPRKKMPASGNIVCGSDRNVFLKVCFSGAQDLSWFKALAPDSIFALQIMDLDFDEANLANLKYLSGLKQLNLQKTEFSDTGVHYITQLKDLEQLCLTGTNITGKSIAALAVLPKLQSLDLANNNIGDDLSGLQQLKNLHFLQLSRCNLTDKGLSKLRPLTQLWQLALSSNPKITNEGLKNLSGMKKLASLELFETKIDGRALPYIEQLPALQLLDVSVGFFGVADERALKQALPKCILKQLGRHISPVPTEMFAPLH